MIYDGTCLSQFMTVLAHFALWRYGHYVSEREQIKRPEDFGYLVKTERVDRGLTQSQLAEQAHVSQRWLSNFESGKSPRAELSKVMSVTRALGLVYLMTEETKPVLSPEMQALEDAARAKFGAPLG